MFAGRYFEGDEAWKLQGCGVGCVRGSAGGGDGKCGEG